MRPLIGVTAYTPPGYDGKAYALPHEYVGALGAAGADVVILPVGADAAVLERLDALVLAGGGDLDAQTYGGATHETTYMVDPARDAYEVALAEGALERALPLLAICRGMQVVNVALGGNLIAHVPDRFGERVLHRLPPREPVAHSVDVAAGSRLAEVIGAGPHEVVSWHHQAVDRLGRDLRAVAWAEDGLVEAVELDSPEFLVAVQWHPELNASTDAAQATLFSDFVAAAERR